MPLPTTVNTPRTYHEKLPPGQAGEVFRKYQYIVVKEGSTSRNTGILIEDGCFDLMFMAEADVRVEIKGMQARGLPRCLALCRPAMPYRLDYPQTLTLFCIKIQPWAASLIVPSATKDIVDLTAWYGSEIEEFRKQLFLLPSFEEMTLLADAFFEKYFYQDMSDRMPTKDICERIYTADGDISVNELVDQSSMYRQKMNQIFLSHTHRSVKEFATFIRIRAAVKYMMDHPHESLTRIGLQMGYYDQSHFIKDVRRTTGMSPSKILANVHLYSEQLK